MKFTFAIISFISAGASAQNLRQGRDLVGRGQGRPQQLPAGRQPPEGGVGLPAGGMPDGLPDGFSGGFPGGGRPGGRPGGDRTPGLGGGNGAGDVLDHLNITGGIDDFVGRFNLTDGDMMPPCPPERIMERLGVTAEDLGCNPDFDFSGMISGNRTDKIPCPTQEMLDDLNLDMTVEDLPCNPEAEFRFGNFTDDRLPCPPQELLDQLNKTVDELPCNPDLEFPNLGNLTMEDFSDDVPCPPQERLDRFNISQADLPCNPDLVFAGRRPGGFGGDRPFAPQQQLPPPTMPGNNNTETRGSGFSGRKPQFADRRPGGDGNLNLPGDGNYDGGDAVDFLGGRFNITDEEISDFLDQHFNFSDGDMMPPCPPEELLERFGITADDLECDPDFDFSGSMVGNFSDKIPGNFSIDELTDKIPCPPQEMLDRFNISQDDLPCNPDLEFPNRSIFGQQRPNRTIDICEGEAVVTCALGGGLFNSNKNNRTGIIVCRETHRLGGKPASSRCINPDRARESDECGCCGGECPQICSCECVVRDSGEIGVLVESRFGFNLCVSAEQSVSEQLSGRYSCVEDEQCPPLTRRV